MTYAVAGTTKDGSKVYYTGRAGAGWVSPSKSESFTYGAEGAAYKATLFNKATALHGITFQAEVI